MISNIVLDMGNVLLDYDPKRFIAPFVEKEEDRKAIIQELFSSAEWIGGDLGTYTDEMVMAAAFKRLPERLHGAVRAVMGDFYKRMPAYPDTERLITTLLDKGFNLYLLSNVGVHFDEMRKNIPHLDRFCGEFLSYQVKLIKPQPEIFAAFCEKYHLAPETCLFVDDSPANAFGAMRAGMKGFVFRGDADKLLEYVEENR